MPNRALFTQRLHAARMPNKDCGTDCEDTVLSVLDSDGRRPHCPEQGAGAWNQARRSVSMSPFHHRARCLVRCLARLIAQHLRAEGAIIPVRLSSAWSDACSRGAAAGAQGLGPVVQARVFCCGLRQVPCRILSFFACVPAAWASTVRLGLALNRFEFALGFFLRDLVRVVSGPLEPARSPCLFRFLASP
jgi:hypothetical protein